MRIAQNKQLALLLAILSLTLAVTLEVWLYKSGKAALQGKVDTALKEAVSEELDKCYNESGLPEYSLGARMSNQKKSYTFTDNNRTDTFEIDLTSNKVRVTEAYNRRMEHTILGKMGEIPLDSIVQSWNQILQRAGITSANALRLHVNNSNNPLTLIGGDSTLCKRENRCTSSIYAGLSSEIEFEPFIRFSWFTIIKNAHIGILAEINIILILGFGVFILVIYRKRKVIRIGNLRYHIKEELIYVNGKSIRLSRQSEKLLFFLLHSSNFYAANHNIILHLWKTEDISVNERLRQAVSELRNELKANKITLNINSEKGGYQIRNEKTTISSKI